jgi:adenine/guanine phosphoribosyltransferase-like PRPP-binding protein
MNPEYRTVKIANFLEENGAFYSREIEGRLGVSWNDISRTKDRWGVMSVPHRLYAIHRSHGAKTGDYFNRLARERIYFTKSWLFDAIRRVREDLVLKPEDVKGSTKLILKNLIVNKFPEPVNAYFLDYYNIGIPPYKRHRKIRTVPPFYDLLDSGWSFWTAKHLGRKIDLPGVDVFVVPQHRGTPIGYRIQRLTKKPVVVLRKEQQELKEPSEIRIGSGTYEKKFYIEAASIGEHIRGQNACLLDDSSRTFKTVDGISEFVWRNGGEIDAAVLLANEHVAQGHSDLSHLAILPSF